MNSTPFISIVSFWEIAIKLSTGKLSLTQSLEAIEAEVRRQGIAILPLNFQHILHVQGLPFHHRDPFDRLLIAQAMEERLTLVTRDVVFRSYPVETLW